MVALTNEFIADRNVLAPRRLSEHQGITEVSKQDIPARAGRMIASVPGGPEQSSERQLLPVPSGLPRRRSRRYVKEAVSTQRSRCSWSYQTYLRTGR